MLGYDIKVLFIAVISLFYVIKSLKVLYWLIYFKKIPFLIFIKTFFILLLLN